MKQNTSPYIPEKNYYRMPRKYFDLWLMPDELAIICMLMSNEYKGKEYDDTYPQMMERINISRIRLQTAMKTLRAAGLVTHRYGRGLAGETRSYYRLVPLPEDPGDRNIIALKLSMARGSSKNSRKNLSTLSTAIHKPADHCDPRPRITAILTADHCDPVLINPFINPCINRGAAVDNSSACTASESVRAQKPSLLRWLKYLFKEA